MEIGFKSVAIAILWFFLVTALTIIADRYVSTTAAAIVAVVSLILICFVYRGEIARSALLFLLSAKTNPNYLWLGSLAVAIAAGALFYVVGSWAVRHVSTEDTGLTFTEVIERVPDEFILDFGNNRGMFPKNVLKQQVPLERLTGIKFPGTIPLRIYFDNRGAMRVDATLYGRDGEVNATIERSNFKIRNPLWDRNWDAIAFELVDEKQVPFFQIERPKENLLKVRGIFRTSQGALLVATDNGIMYNPTTPTPPPQRLFRYPSAVNLHIRAER